MTRSLRAEKRRQHKRDSRELANDLEVLGHQHAQQQRLLAFTTQVLMTRRHRFVSFLGRLLRLRPEVPADMLAFLKKIRNLSMDQPAVSANLHATRQDG